MSTADPKLTPPVKTPTRRAMAKQQTRAKVLAAARRLFSEQGYEGATIRDIAAMAGMSTGAVFANFTDKSDLFREIMITDMEAVARTMVAAGEQRSSLDEALLAMFEAGYAFYQSQLPLARAAFSVSWTPEGGGFLRGTSAVRMIQDAIAAHVTAAIGRGEVRADPDLPLRTRMLFEAYLANYPHAIFDGWTLEGLRDRARDQVRILLAGIRAA